MHARHDRALALIPLRPTCRCAHAHAQPTNERQLILIRNSRQLYRRVRPGLDRTGRAISRAEASIDVPDRYLRREIRWRLRQLPTAIRHESIDHARGEIIVEWYGPGPPLAPIADGWYSAPKSGVRLLAAGDTLTELTDPVAFELLLLGRLVAPQPFNFDVTLEDPIALARIIACM